MTNESTPKVVELPPIEVHTVNHAGRPTKYDPECLEEIANLCAGGATDFEVAEHLGVVCSTLYLWKQKHPEFAQAMKLGKDACDERVVNSMYHRAVGYNHAAVKIMQHEGTPVLVQYTEHVPPDMAAITMWLTNRRSHEWRAKQSLEHSGPDGSPISLTHADAITDAELESIARAGSATPPEPSPGEK